MLKKLIIKRYFLICSSILIIFLKIAYCYSIIDANNRVSLPTTSELAMNNRMFFNNKQQKGDLNNTNAKTSSAFHENPLDSFFPFDPYLLKRSKPFIEKYNLLDF